MNKYKNREIFPEILKLIDIPEIIVIHGARQVGKTTLMKMTIDSLEKKYNDDIFYFDLEKKEFLDLANQGAEEIIRYIKGKKKKSGKTFLFIDEVQYLNNPSSLLKIFYDHYKEDFKLIVSGSSSFAIKSKFKDSLVGRTIDLEIFGLSFNEYLNFKNLSYDLNSKSSLINEELKGHFKDYLLFGTYPQVVLADNFEIKKLYLNNIIEKYIYRDIKDLAEIKDLKKFNDLLRLLAAQVGNLVNVNELANSLKMARQTINQYLFILENTYIIKLIQPFSKNIRSELSKMPVVYFEDLGILNILKNQEFNNNIEGHDFQNSIFNYLRRRTKVKNIYFWRTTNKQEIDFIIKAKKITPLEVKLTYRDKYMKSLQYFLENYSINLAYCVVINKKDSKLDEIKQIYPWQIESLDF